MDFTQFNHKNILLIGYGKEGQSTERYLRKHAPDAKITVTDQKNGEEYLKNQEAFDIRIKSAGIPKNLIAKPYTTATNIFFSAVKGLTIGVTGTKGKSTTSSLIYSILKNAGKRVHLVGNIGTPWFDDVDPVDSEDHIFVCELSSYQLDDIEYSPDISVFVSFFPEHMNYHGSVDKYWEAKSRIIKKATKDNYFVYNPDVEELRKLAQESPAKSVPYVSTPDIPAVEISLIGEHNQQNIKAARTVAGILNINDTIVLDSIRSFLPLPHRLQNVGTHHGVTFFDDAISTTPESTMCAIKSLGNISVILLGGMDRGYDFTGLVRLLNEKNIRHIVLFPDSG